MINQQPDLMVTRKKLKIDPSLASKMMLLTIASSGLIEPKTLCIALKDSCRIDNMEKGV